MPSLLQSEASRINGAKSRGPKTAAGKANSSRNAPTHGVLSATLVIEGECAPRFAALLASLRTELKPRSCIEDGLVEDLACYRWRQRRLLSMETTSFTHAVLRQAPQPVAESGATPSSLSQISTGTQEVIENMDFTAVREPRKVPQIPAKPAFLWRLKGQ